MGLGNRLATGLLVLGGWGVLGAGLEEPNGGADPFMISPPGIRPDNNVGDSGRDLGFKDFTLRHVYHHGASEYPDLHRYIDVPKDAPLILMGEHGEVQETEVALRARTMSMNIQRLTDRRHSAIDKIFEYASIHGEAVSLPSSAWTVDDIPAPNHTDKTTVLTFAKIAANAYVEEAWKGDWQDVKGGFNYTDDFGWEEDGLRGHIFADETNGTVIIGLKGTSMAIFDGAETTTNDKVNDNLFGSCCCGQGGPYLWKQVCKCMTSAYTCNNTCLVQNLQEKSHYYTAVQDLYRNVTERYPDAEIWLSGHSLGGVVSSLLGLTYGLPTMTFEAFPDALAASRLGLPVPPGYRIGSHQSRTETGIHHFGHTADPVFMGSCNAGTSACSLAGYAFEGVCHTGQTCVYDTVQDFGWRKGVGSHRILSVIKDVLKKYDSVPVCEADTECSDCFLWKFFESNGSETTTSSSTSSSTRIRTRTETCKTPGWWGCLDETTTSAQTTTSTSSTSTSTCKTPGWFGCNDPTTTTTSSLSKSGARTAAPEPTITTSSPRPTSAVSSTTKTTCFQPGWFGCNDPLSTTTSAPSKPTSSHLPTTRRKHCVTRSWFGWCREYRWEDGPAFQNDL